MDYVDYALNVVDFARQIISMDNTIERLEWELAHEKEMNKILQDGQNRSLKHGQEMTGMILSALVDPESPINQRAINRSTGENNT
jgi:hypothetical protein